VLPLHQPPTAHSAAPASRRGRIRALVLTGVSLAVLAAVVGPTADLVVLLLALTSLGAATVLGLRTRRPAVRPAPARPVARASAPSPADPEPVTRDDLAERLRTLHEEHVELVNLALSEGREDLVQELSDSYADQALRLITAEGHQFPVR
jgi:hypothetical protein